MDYLEKVRKEEREELKILEPEVVEELPAIAPKEKIQNKLERLGFKQATKTISKIERMRVAYERYMFITPQTVQKFNEKLRKETLEEDKNARKYKQLVFSDITTTSKIPPESVLDKLEIAQREQIFDKFEVGYIDWVKEVKDPILFGRIEGCEDYFFIGQWDDDVKIEDLIFQGL